MKTPRLDMRSQTLLLHWARAWLFALVLLGACAPAAEEGAAPGERAAPGGALVCSGAGCTCGPTFGIGLVQGTNGTGDHKNFEVVVPHAGGGFSHYFRDNVPVRYPAYLEWYGIIDEPNQPWHGPFAFGSGDVGGVALIESNSGGGNLEVVATVGNQLVAYYRSRSTLEWAGPTLIASGVRGQPALVQNRNQSPGNFEVVVPLAAGGLQHFWRNNGVVGTPWNAGPIFATGRVYDAVTMIQSNLGGGNLEVLGLSGEQLWATFRNASGWQPPVVVSVSGTPIHATGIPSFVQSASGNFELVVPTPNGLWHYWRDNGALGYPWRAPTVIDSTTNYTSAALIQSSYGAGTNLEVVAQRGNSALVAFRRSAGIWEWRKIQDGVTHWAGQVFGAEPCCDAATKGKWSDPLYTYRDAIGLFGTLPMHASLLRNGKVLFMGFDNYALGLSQILDPNTGVMSPTYLVEGDPDMPPPAPDAQPHVYCGGHTFLPDGRLWIAGGHYEDRGAMHLFDPATSTFTHLEEPLPNARWYPTVTRLASGKAFVISGSKELGALRPGNPVNNSWQLFDPVTNKLVGLEHDEYDGFPTPFSATDSERIQLYPFVFALPDGRVAVHSRRTTRLLNPETNVWSEPYIAQYLYSRTYPSFGSAVLRTLSYTDSYRARLLMFGGAGNVGFGPKDPAYAIVPATNTAEELDLGALPKPAWKYIASMSYRRVLNTAILLPDGKVFNVGGGTMGRADQGLDPVLIPELYDPATNTWTQMCSMRVPRLYHGVALLLPDARVLTAGKDHLFNQAPYNWPERRIEIFSPPYLNKGSPRPIINTVPTANLGYNALFNVTVNTSAVPPASITKAVLMAPGAVTHGSDMNQRAVELKIESRTTNGLSLRSPLNSAVAPPGDYMLFLLSSAGVPSVAKFVIVR